MFASEKNIGTVREMRRILLVIGFLAVFVPTSTATAQARDTTSPSDRATLLAYALGSPEAAELALSLVLDRTIATDDTRIPVLDAGEISSLPVATQPAKVDALPVNAPTTTADFVYVSTLPPTIPKETAPPATNLSQMLPKSRLPLLTIPLDPSAWICPLWGYAFSDTWGDPRSGGRTHEGTDIIAPIGAPIRSVATGTVMYTHFGAHQEELGGITLAILDAHGDHAYYGHLSQIAPGIVVGAHVDKGQIIGLVGQTGNARFSVPHLHFGFYPQNGPAQNATAALQVACANTSREPLSIPN